MNTINATLRVLGMLLAALSVVSFVQSVLDVGVLSALQPIVSYYRTIAHAVFGVPAALMGLALPQSLVDFWTVSFVGAGAYVRTEGIERCRAFRDLSLDPQAFGWKLAVFLVFGLSGLGIFVAVAAIWPLTYVDAFHEEPMDLMKGAIANVFLVCVAASLFFVLNAFFPDR